MRKIVYKFVNDINDLLQEKKLHVSLSESAVEELAKRGYDPLMGARPLGRIIENEIKIPLSKSILKDAPINGTTILVIFRNDKFEFEYKNNTTMKAIANNVEVPNVNEKGMIILDKFKPK